MDILGPLIETHDGHKYLMVITDRFSKLTKSVPLKDISYKTVAHAFLNHWALTYGPPTLLVTDNGKQFVSKFFQELFRVLGTASLFTTTYKPKENGQVERFNRIIVDTLRTYLGDHSKDWDRYVHLITYAYNNTVQYSTGLTPFELGVSNPPNPLYIDYPPPRRDENAAQYYTEWSSHLELLINHSKDCLEKAQKRYKCNFDRKVRPPVSGEDIRAENFAFVRREPSQKGGGKDDQIHKLMTVAFGPFEVTRVDPKTAWVKYPDGQLERITRDRLISASKSCWPYPPTVKANKPQTHDPDERYYGIDRM